MTPDTLPAEITALTSASTVETVTVGWSQDAVYRLTDGDTVRYLKTGADLRHEHDRLRWMENRLPTPRVLHYTVIESTHYLLTSAVPGVMTHEAALPSDTLVRLMADGLKLWHALPIDSCPFDHRANALIARAREKITQGAIDPQHFDMHLHGYTAQDVLDRALQLRPEHEDLVVTHGDYCMPNILIDPQTEKVTGFVDVGRVGVADRFSDLAQACRSITWNIGMMWVEVFLAHYGVPMDRAKYNFYTLLDELQ